MKKRRPDLIEIKWLLRDIKASRSKLADIDPERLQELQDRGFLEDIDGRLVLTERANRLIS